MASYTLLGTKWASNTISWSVATLNYPGDSAYPFSNVLTPAAVGLVSQAFQRWADVSGLNFVPMIDTPTAFGAANIRVGFGKFSTSTTGYVGQAQGQSGPFFRSDEIIRVEDFAEEPVEDVNGLLKYRNFDVSVYQIVLHEIGHALGLGHSSTSNDVMYGTVSSLNRDLSASDIAGIRAIYPRETLQLRGLHTDYIIAQVSGTQAYIQDKVAGRDGTRTVNNLGTLRFTDGTGLFDKTGAAEDVTRLYQAAFGRTPDLQGLKDNTSLIDDHTIGIKALAASFASSPEFNARYGRTDDAAYARLMYQNVLHRAPDAAGLQNWINNVGATSRGEALLAFSDSQENHRQTLPIAGSQADAEATRLYQAALNRAPDAPGLAAVSDALHNGASIEQVAQGFVNSGEFARAYGALSNDAFVTQLYANVLHRVPDPSGRQTWLNDLATGGTRAHVLSGLADSNENRIATAGLTHDAWVFVG